MASAASRVLLAVGLLWAPQLSVAGETDPPRAVPDYDGRPPVTTVEEDLLWLPRIVLAPVYFVVEFVVRKPLSVIVPAVEASGSAGSPLDLFTFGPNNDLGITPKFYLETGFRPRVGLYFFYDNFIAPKNDLRATFTAGGENWFKASLLDRVPLAMRGEFVTTELEFRLAGILRPDLRFWGTGARSKAEDESDYELRSVGGTVRIRQHLNEVSSVESWVALRKDAFADPPCDPALVTGEGEYRCRNRSVATAVAEGRYAEPVGFNDPAAVGGTGILAKFDTRNAWPAAGSGVAGDFRAELGMRDGRSASGWVGYAAAIAGFLDLTGTRRVLSLLLDARAVDAIEPTDGVPFTELAGAKRIDDVPDLDLMRGFAHGRLSGGSATVATLEYVWPVWSFIDASLQASVGNVWERRFEDFDPEAMRFSFVAGLRTPNRRDHTFNLLVGFGTAPFDEGAMPEGPRVVFGSTTGF